MSSNQHEIDEVFLREARIGLMVLTALGAVFLYVAFGKLGGWHQPEPAPFLNQSRSNQTGPGQFAESAKKNNVPPSLSVQPESWVTVPPVVPDDRAESNDLQAIEPTGELTSWQSPQSANFLTNTIEQDVEAIPREPVAYQPRLESPKRPQPNLQKRNPDVSPPSSFVPPTRMSTERNGFSAPIRTEEGASSHSGQHTKSTDISELPMDRNRFRIGKESTEPQSAAKPPALPVSSGSFSVTTGQTEPRNGNDHGQLETARVLPNGNLAVRPASAMGSFGQKNKFRADEPKQNATSQDQTPKPDAPSPATTSPEDAIPLPAREVSYQTSEGEGFWLVAQKVYGDGRFFDALYQFNRRRVDSFNDVPEGSELIIPPISELRRRWPYLCPNEEFKTEGGETLFEIARDKLGQASRYTELIKLNFSRLPKGVNQDSPLPANLTLELPALSMHH